jgi:hypothetical protein
VDAMVTLEDIGNLICTKTLIIVGVELENLFGYLLIFFGAMSRYRVEMLIICTSVDT